MTSKSASRNSMRVATIFTGVAAMGGMTQVAHAQVTRPDVKLQQGTQIQWCNRASRATWVHMGYYDARVNGNAEGSPESKCIGFRGNAGISMLLDGFCGGNNSGHLLGYNSVANLNWHYGHGNFYAEFSNYRYGGWGQTQTISISGYGGNDTCRHWISVEP
jgi:hypothetical protein